MRTAIKKTKVYYFDELPEESQEKAIENYYDINLDFWYECIIEDAEEVGIEITAWDLDRYSINGLLQADLETVINNILEKHGDTTDTYKTAKIYQTALEELKTKYLKGRNIDIDSIEYDEYCEYEDEKEDLSKQFKHDILSDYLHILKNEYEYQASKEAIIETFRVNEYEFDINGHIYY